MQAAAALGLVAVRHSLINKGVTDRRRPHGRMCDIRPVPRSRSAWWDRAVRRVSRTMAPCHVSANPQVVCRRERSPEHRLAERRIRQGFRGHLPTLLMWHVPPLLRSCGSAGDGSPMRSLRRHLIRECGTWRLRRCPLAQSRPRPAEVVVSPCGSNRKASSRIPREPRPEPPCGSLLSRVLGTPTGREGRDRRNQRENPT